MKKRIRYIVSLMVLLGTLGTICATTTVFADEKDGKCNCQWTNGNKGIIRSGVCNVEDCWFEIG